MNDILELLGDLASQGGPHPADDAELDSHLARLDQDASSDGGDVDLEHVRGILPLSVETMQGFAYAKPNGYAGCFEIIERIYRRHHASAPELFNWDRYWQSRPAAEAVRNRKSYFINLVLGLVSEGRDASVLNVASGPCRDVYELFLACPELPVRMHCIDRDPRSIDHAARLCAPVTSRITFSRANALVFRGADQFDLVWSAGLFDYLDDRAFVRLARRLARSVSPGGELVIGNFSPTNPNRGYMRVVDWHLNYRSPDQLVELADRAGFAQPCVTIDAEPIGVNLFLRVRVPDSPGASCEDGVLP